jgi:hypothetical protein
MKTVKMKTAQSKSNIKKFLKIVKEHKLMYSNGGISTIINDSNSISTIGLLYFNGEPVSCAITTKPKAMFNMYDIAAYTRHDHRNKGFSKQLLKKVVARDLKLNIEKKYKTSNNYFYSKILSMDLIAYE